MSNTLGKAIRVTIFGESHGAAIGAVIDGVPPGLKVDSAYIAAEMDRRRAAGAASTARKEADIPEFLSGVKNGYTEGTPLALIIKNENIKSSDYDKLSGIARPSHADWTAQAKHLGYQDASGGGHFSGRLTAPLVAAGAILKQALGEKDIKIETRIVRLHGIENPTEEQIEEEILKAKEGGDSVGGVLETVITGLDAGYGEPWFGSLEGEIANAVFSIPAVKGVEFGAGFAIADMFGSEANDAFYMDGARIATKTNNSGGMQGGISNGMPIVFRTAIKPTPSIAKKLQTVNFLEGKDTEIEIAGRHDPAIIRRAMPVVDVAAAIVIADMIARRFGYMALRSEK